MFTGLVEEKGRIATIDTREGGTTLTIQATAVLEDTRIGDSIAVDGTCLTVTSLGDGAFTVDLAPETLERTSLGWLDVGSSVNLERSLRAASRMGGHFVQGHVDQRGTISETWEDGESRRVKIAFDPSFAHLVVPKGFIAVDGISLTVVEAGRDFLTLMLIPHTLEMVTLAEKRPGDPVNLEFDILGKYIDRLMAVRLEGAGGGQSPKVTRYDA